ncbi:hypothetical protein DQZ57_12595 [Salmonella enterica subsp. enterica serovar Sandiego]|nr:hypothetical protein [Salmonella enterica subsp. enterica serovar Sandiego]
MKYAQEVGMDWFQQSCSFAYKMILERKRMTSLEMRTEGKYKHNELRDILFLLRIKYGVISVKGKGIFLNEVIYRDWLHYHHRKNVVKTKQRRQ